MKSRSLSKWALSAAVGGMFLTGGCLDKSSAPPPVLTMAATEVDPDPGLIPTAYDVEAPSQTEPTPALESIPAPPDPAPEVVTAPAKVVTSDKPLPANLRLSGPAMEIIKLANSGMDEAVLLSYVTNSMSTFDLGAEEIIYLNDIGVPGTVVSVMIQHDQGLRLAAANAAAAAAQPAPPGPPAPLPGYPPPAEVAPQPEAAATYPPLTPPSAEVSYGDFYDGLAPYGTWVDVEGYGRCWQPSAVVVNPGWQPYFDNGCWAYTDCGWYWSSYYSWGWAPFHYGRWFRHSHWGWCWAPDTIWGPSWVCWRQSSAFCGWAPLPPGCFFTAGVGFTFHGQRVQDFNECGLRPNDYRFVGWNDFHDRHLRGHDLAPHDVNQVFNKTVVVNRMVMNNNTVINQGIAPQRVANATQHEVRQVALLDRTVGRPTAVRGTRGNVTQRAVAVYRPEKPQQGQDADTVAGGPGGVSRQGPSSVATAAPSVPVAHRAESPALTRPAPSQIQAPVATPIQGLAPPQTVPAMPQRPVRLAEQAMPVPTTATPAPTSHTPYARPMLPPAPVTPPVPAAQPVQRPNVSRATPWLETRPAAPAPVPVQPQYTPPTYVPQRPYIPPPAPSVPMDSRPAPSRPVMAEVPRYAPAPAPSRPAVVETPRYSPPPPPPPPLAPQSSGVQTRSAPPAPAAAPDRGTSQGNSQRR